MFVFVLQMVILESCFGQLKETRIVPLLSRPIPIQIGKNYAIKTDAGEVLLFVIVADPLFPWRRCVVTGWKFNSIDRLDKFENDNAFPLVKLTGDIAANEGFQSKCFEFDNALKVACVYWDVYFEFCSIDGEKSEIRIDAKKAVAIATCHREGAVLVLGKFETIESLK